MILPTKHVSQDRALLTVGLRILQCLTEAKTVSAVWEDIPRAPKEGKHVPPTLNYDSFILTLDFLFLTGAIKLREGRLNRSGL